jgi:L-ascorbate metabolism protein UlaG (beta-lactamase superfamily)
MLLHIARIFGFATATALIAGAAKDQQVGVTVKFLANEGVMLSSGGQQVLIDALFQKYETGYAVPADSTRRSLERATAPFDSVDVILVTHRHGDHFHPSSVVAHMSANPHAWLVTSAQVIDSMRGRLAGAHGVASRILPRTTAPGVWRRENVNGITVHLLGIPHGGQRHRAVEHLGFIVELGGRRVLHVGDTDTNEAAFAPFRLDTARIDIALLPQWMVTSAEGRHTIEQWIKPRQVVAFHVGEGEGARATREVLRAIPRRARSAGRSTRSSAEENHLGWTSVVQRLKFDASVEDSWIKNY